MPLPAATLIRATLAAAALALAAPALAACPVGTYDAVGWNPGSPNDGPASYRATVVIRDRGADVCEIEWDLGGRQHFSAVALFDPRSGEMHGAYANLEQGWFGIISYRRSDEGFAGEWAVYNSGASDRGREVLIARR